MILVIRTHNYRPGENILPVRECPLQESSPPKKKIINLRSSNLMSRQSKEKPKKCTRDKETFNQTTRKEQEKTDSRRRC